MNLNDINNLDLEAWFAEGGLVATVVARCPAPECEICAAPTHLPAAA